MKFKEKIYTFIFVILVLTFSYSLCSTRELRNPNSIFNTRRNRFCSTPFSVFVILVFILIFVFNIY